MRIKNIQDAEIFLSVVDACKGNVTLKSQYGDVCDAPTDN